MELKRPSATWVFNHSSVSGLRRMFIRAPYHKPTWQNNQLPFGAAEQKLLVPFPPPDRRRKDTRRGPAERGRPMRNFLARRRLHSRVAHDAFLEMLPAGLELRLNQFHV